MYKLPACCFKVFDPLQREESRRLAFIWHLVVAIGFHCGVLYTLRSTIVVQMGDGNKWAEWISY